MFVYRFVNTSRCIAILGTLLLGTVLTKAQSNYATPYTFTTFAGLASAGSADGAATVARFSYPQGVAVDTNGNVFVADTNNFTIREISASGTVTTIAGSAGIGGFADGVGSAARFWLSQGVAVDSSGNVFVIDTPNQTVRKITPAGVVTTFAGNAQMAPGSLDGVGSAARFYDPQGIAIDSHGMIYVSDYGSGTIRKITPGGEVTTFAGNAGNPGFADGTGSAARFQYPYGVAVDASDNVYVADYGNSAIRKITPGGEVTTLPTGPNFSYPRGVAVDGAGNVYFTATNLNVISKISPDGTVSVVAGLSGQSGTVDGVGTAARFDQPYSIAASVAGDLYVTDFQDNRIRKITPDGTVTTYAGLPTHGDADGASADARFYSPGAVVIDSVGNAFVADTKNYTIRKIAVSGAVSTFAGSPMNQGTTDGIGSSARFFFPMALAIDTADNLYVGDTGNNLIRKITPDGTVSTLAMNINQATGMAVDAGGNVFVVEGYNHVIRKITPGGVVTTVAGKTGISGYADGTGTAAQFSYPKGMAIDTNGNLFVADSNNATVRKITPGGVVTTLAGTGGVGGETDGTGSAARFALPWGLTLDASGNVYVSDFNTIRKISAAGVVTTIAGSWQESPGSLDGTGSAARFNQPQGLALDRAGNIYVADSANHTIRWGALAKPSLVSATTAGGLPGQDFACTVEFSGALPDRFSVTGLPADFSFDAGTGLIAGHPTTTGRYPVTLQATNGAGTSTATLDLIVGVLPVVTMQPGNQYVTVGAHVSFTASAIGNPAPAYQWKKGGVDIPGATSATLTLNNVQLTDAGNYTVLASNSLDSATSNIALLNVVTAPLNPVKDDFNNDGQTDILWRNIVNGNVSAWFMNGTTMQSSLIFTNVVQNWQIAGSGDFNNDGQTDILWRNNVNGNVSAWLMNGTAIQSQVVVATGIAPNWQIAGTGDFDGDGQVDILWRNNVNGNVSVWLMNGTAIQSQVMVATGIAPNWQVAGTGDFDGDGQVDILWRNSVNGNVSIWLMNGTAIGSQVMIATGIAPNWQIAGAWDFDDDGQVDILWRNGVNGNVSIWLMNGTVIQSQVMVATGVSQNWQIAK